MYIKFHKKINKTINQVNCILTGNRKQYNCTVNQPLLVGLIFRQIILNWYKKALKDELTLRTICEKEVQSCRSHKVILHVNKKLVSSDTHVKSYKGNL